MGFNRPAQTSLEVSGFTQSHEIDTVLWSIEQAIENCGSTELLEEAPEHNRYSGLKTFRVTLTIEEV